jgi:hypothetical protein
MPTSATIKGPRRVEVELRVRSTTTSTVVPRPLGDLKVMNTVPRVTVASVKL